MKDLPKPDLSVHKQNSNQYFIMNYQLIQNHDNILFYLQGQWHEYGIDWDGPLPDENDDYAQVEVPETRNPLSEDNFHELVQTIDPLSASESYGADIYLSVVSFLSELDASSN